VDWLRLALLASVTLFACLTAFHALVTKRDPRAALGWIAVSLMFPFVGPVLYFLFGINRVRTRAQEMHARNPFSLGEVYDPETAALEAPAPRDPPLGSELAAVSRLAGSVARRKLVPHNSVEMLHGGEEAYPAMLDAIAAARGRVYVSTYIFESNATGRRFVDALAAATERGVDVRVLLDGVG
jgi:cardiolipin synthase